MISPILPSDSKNNQPLDSSNATQGKGKAAQSLSGNKIIKNLTGSKNFYEPLTKAHLPVDAQNDFIRALTNQKANQRGFGKAPESTMFRGVLEMLGMHGSEISIQFKRRHLKRVKAELPLLRAFCSDLSFKLSTKSGTGLPLLIIQKRGEA